MTIHMLYFWKAQGPKKSKMIFLTVKYRNVQIQCIGAGCVSQDAHVVPTSWLNYLRRQFVFVCIFSLYTFVCSLFTLCFFVSFSLYFCLFFIYSLSFLLFVFVRLNLLKLSLIVFLSPFHSLHNSTLQRLFYAVSTKSIFRN